MSIRFEKKDNIFNLITKNSQYQIKISDIGIVMHTYYGDLIGDCDMSYLHKEIDRGFSGNPYEKRNDRGVSLDLIPQEYTGCGAGDYRINSIDLINSKGNSVLDLRYKSHRIFKGKYTLNGLPYVRENDSCVDTLEIKLFDEQMGIEVILRYGVFEEKDIITRQAEIVNKDKEVIFLNKASSFAMDIPFGQFDLIHFQGRHCMERQFERKSLGHDIVKVASKRGMSSHQNNPFIILADVNSNENHGECYGFMLMYSGNHSMEVEMDQVGSVRVVGGINEDNFTWKLERNESFHTPETILAYSSKGFNDLSHKYHDIIRENVIPQKFMNMKRPVLINNWEATYFDFNTKKIKELIDQAKDLGLEMFVLDDGWFGNRNDDNGGLGDWWVNLTKLPGGLKELTDYANAVGMKFGLWFEPEMVNENSKLYKEHPDWAITDPSHKPNMSRNQLLLDMSKKEVVDYLYDKISKVLNEANIEYIKWDFNRSMSNVYSNGIDANRQRETSHRFILGAYSLMERITTNYPNVIIEGCAGGGGRFDAGILFYSPQIWCSDDTDPIARLKIQKGTSYGYPVTSMGSHVSASPNHQTNRSTPIETRAVVAMCGTFGYELDLTKLCIEDKEKIKDQIKFYNKNYWLIQKGDYYRLEDQYRIKNSNAYYEAVEFVAKDKKEALLELVITDVHANPEFPYVKLKGLDTSKIYDVFENEKLLCSISGSALMNGGLTVELLNGDYPSAIYKIIAK